MNKFNAKSFSLDDSFMYAEMMIKQNYSINDIIRLSNAEYYVVSRWKKNYLSLKDKVKAKNKLISIATKVKNNALAKNISIIEACKITDTQDINDNIIKREIRKNFPSFKSQMFERKHFGISMEVSLNVQRPNKYDVIDFNEWKIKFKPVCENNFLKVVFSNNPTLNTFECCYVWTITINENHEYILKPGFNLGNIFGYLITAIKHQYKAICVKLPKGEFEHFFSD